MKTTLIRRVTLLALALALSLGAPQLTIFAQDAAGPREVMVTYQLM